jgi:DNA polymerase III delta prime subunit
MLPKIIVTGMYERETLLSSLGLSIGSTLGYEGSESKIDDLRRFINFGINLSSGGKQTSMVIWDADRLSPECQAVLLKPLEDSKENVSLFLVVANENGMLSTILSRCVVSNSVETKNFGTSYWKSVLECFSKGPAKCLALADELEKSEMEALLEEVIEKLSAGLVTGVSKNRLKILKLAIDCLAKIKYTNVNSKLAMGNFLLGAWRLIKLG